MVTKVTVGFTIVAGIGIHRITLEFGVLKELSYSLGLLNHTSYGMIGLAVDDECLVSHGNE